MLNHPASHKQDKYLCKLEKFKDWLIWDGYIGYDGSNISHVELVEGHKRKVKTEYILKRFQETGEMCVRN